LTRYDWLLSCANDSVNRWNAKQNQEMWLMHAGSGGTRRVFRGAAECGRACALRFEVSQGSVIGGILATNQLGVEYLAAGRFFLRAHRLSRKIV
jgi:hypothetical protein